MLDSLPYRRHWQSQWHTQTSICQCHPAEPLLAYLMLPGQQAIFIHPSGHFLAKYPDELGDELLYVVETDDGRQRTLSAEEFAQEFGWENDPTQVQVLPPPDDDGG